MKFSRDLTAAKAFIKALAFFALLLPCLFVSVTRASSSGLALMQLALVDVPAGYESELNPKATLVKPSSLALLYDPGIPGCVIRLQSTGLRYTDEAFNALSDRELTDYAYPTLISLNATGELQTKRGSANGYPAFSITAKISLEGKNLPLRYTLINLPLQQLIVIDSSPAKYKTRCRRNADGLISSIRAAPPVTAPHFMLPHPWSAGK